MPLRMCETVKSKVKDAMKKRTDAEEDLQQKKKAELKSIVKYECEQLED